MLPLGVPVFGTGRQPTQYTSRLTTGWLNDTVQSLPWPYSIVSVLTTPAGANAYGAVVKLAPVICSTPWVPATRLERETLVGPSVPVDVAPADVQSVKSARAPAVPNPPM